MSDGPQEIYDGFAISNKQVTGVKNMRAMFEANNPRKTPPVLRKFRDAAKKCDGEDNSKEIKIPGVPPKNVITSRPTPITPKSQEDQNANLKKDVGGERKIGGVTRNSKVMIPTAFMKSDEGKSATSPPPVVSPKPAVTPKFGYKAQESRDNGNSSKDEKSENKSAPNLPKSSVSVEKSTVNKNSFDFRANLKPVGQRSGIKKGVSFESDENSGTSSSKREGANSDSSESNVSLRNRGTKGSLQRKSLRTSVITRLSDNKRFRLVNSVILRDAPQPPAKPSKLENVDLSVLLQDYHASVKAVNDEVTTQEEWYDDAGVNPADRPVSLIPEMTEEEEEEYTDVAAPSITPSGAVDDDLYDDGRTAPDGEDDENIYEPPDMQDQIQDMDSGGSAGSDKAEKERIEKELARQKKQEEKERKEREKKEREEKRKKDQEEKEKLKEQKRKEKEEKEMKSRFKISGDIEKQGEGIVINDSKTKNKNELSVQTGELLGIIRMNGNPKGKWLVQNQDGKLGYVDSNNIEVATPTIRNVMDGLSGPGSDSVSDTQGSGENEEIYEAVGEEGEDIYEEFN